MSDHVNHVDRSKSAGDDPHLSRQLSNRHIQLIAIGGAIGTGLFMGSGKTISLAGPSVIFVYMIIGFMLFFVMRAMGELLLSNMSYKSFSDFAADLLGPWAGFFTGWTYWFCWIVTGIADVIAISGYFKYWWPGLAAWIPALLTIAALLLLNLPTVKAFGETEFWFALIKIIAIVSLIIVGIVMVVSGFTAPNGATSGVDNLWNDGGMFPTGFMGFVAGFQIAVFAFVGIELVGTTAAEAKDPEKNLPKAINSIPIRVLLFYVVALTVIICVTPWREIQADKSPFVAMFTLAGLGIAASVINFVVLTSAASSANSGIYSTSRMVFGLAQEGDAPKALGKLNSRKVPANALMFSCIFLLASLILLFSGDSVIEAFTVVTTISALLFMFVWTIILASYLVYRKRRPHLHEASKFKMPGGIVMCWVVLAFFVFILWALTTKDDTLQALLVTPIWFVALGIAWAIIRRRPAHRARYEAFRAELDASRQTDEK
ncbi:MULTISPECIES: D-serine/D-alanine/glycine transporter [Rhodococcus]|uniref:D-serine/D-alanine/glycine:proton symporter (AAT family) n=2 Tax=Nocardiaceae TaxID=85025 RepID=A0A652YT76_NOCGL|nr:MULTISPECIES: D-serine/D-alanine/glycine transporter [Rhodococcus]NMD61166.1 D-serine/D-alanine/glycine transporter [Nocardia globerula]KJF21295.1 D-serine/D-alanine/glycine transporter [Rhodococcus sp. AD45]MCE4264900.1 D-serine/D-alanine/glycine transporter [Rhodococcus globerulus]MDV6266103.1 D-serine/D-alanine/glycine transporter [Rhodococcus globerulus]MDV8068669.1 D-serine/D-alanine/glycine transporter [Rhodococcus sp. IEGM 1366]